MYQREAERKEEFGSNCSLCNSILSRDLAHVYAMSTLALRKKKLGQIYFCIKLIYNRFRVFSVFSVSQSLTHIHFLLSKQDTAV